MNNTKIVLEIPFFIDQYFPETFLKKFNYKFYNKDFFNFDKQFDFFIHRFEKLKNTNCDLICINFNLSFYDFNICEQYFKKAIEFLNKYCDKTLIFKGSSDNKIDEIILPYIIKTIQTPSIIGIINEKTLKSIVPFFVENKDKKHRIIFRSPIDITIAKEMNISGLNLGLSLDDIIIDTDIGGLGYGFEYGYSMMEKIKIEAKKGDKLIDCPIISFVCDEIFKAKELKVDTFDKNWGNINKRIETWESSAIGALYSIGIDYLVLLNFEIINKIKEVQNR